MATDKSSRKSNRAPAHAFEKSEWGIPDWRSGENYGDTENWSMKRWQWEFSRRRYIARQYFDERAQIVYEQQSAFFSVQPEAFPHGRPLRPDEPGFYVCVEKSVLHEIGYYSLPNPRIGKQPELAMFPCTQASRIRPIKPRLGDTIGETLQYCDVELSKKQYSRLGHVLDAHPVKLKETEVALVFDCDRALEPQLEAARRWLKAEYKSQNKKTQHRIHKRKWLKYLRVLDAREANASWQKITDVFFEQGLLDRRADSAGGYRPPPPTAARDIWDAAKALRFNF